MPLADTCGSFVPKAETSFVFHRINRAELGKSFQTLDACRTVAASLFAATIATPGTAIIYTKFLADSQFIDFPHSHEWRLNLHRVPPVQRQYTIETLEEIDCAVPVAVIVLRLGTVKDRAATAAFAVRRRQ